MSKRLKRFFVICLALSIGAFLLILFLRQQNGNKNDKGKREIVSKKESEEKKNTNVKKNDPKIKKDKTNDKKEEIKDENQKNVIVKEERHYEFPTVDKGVFICQTKCFEPPFNFSIRVKGGVVHTYLNGIEITCYDEFNPLPLTLREKITMRSREIFRDNYNQYEDFDKALKLVEEYLKSQKYVKEFWTKNVNETGDETYIPEFRVRWHSGIESRIFISSEVSFNIATKLIDIYNSVYKKTQSYEDAFDAVKEESKRYPWIEEVFTYSIWWGIQFKNGYSEEYQLPGKIGKPGTDLDQFDIRKNWLEGYIKELNEGKALLYFNNVMRVLGPQKVNEINEVIYSNESEINKRIKIAKLIGDTYTAESYERWVKEMEAEAPYR